MNDDPRIERLLADALADLAPSRAPGHLSHDIRSAIPRQRPRPRWLALIKEPPMRTSSSLAVGSPTARVAALIGATILLMAALAGAGLAGSRLLAADGPLVVDQTGGGNYRTIAEALAVAEVGDSILVRPGTYVEAVIIDKDVSLTGDGAVEDVVIMAPEDGPTTPVWASADPYAILVEGVDARLSDLTIRGEPSQVIVKGGSHTLEGLVLEGTGHANEMFFDETDGSSIALTDGSTAVVRGNRLVGGGPIAIFGLSEPLIEGNTLMDGPHIWGDPGDGGVIRGNTIERPFVRGIGVGQASPTIEGNTVVDSRDIGIQVHGGTAVVRDNQIRGAVTGIYVDTDDAAPIIEANVIEASSESGIAVSGAVPSVRANVLRDNVRGIHWLGFDGLIEDNEITGGATGVDIRTGGPTVLSNSVRGAADLGIYVGERATPTLTDNTSCDNGRNLSVATDASAQVDDSNEFCADLAVE